MTTLDVIIVILILLWVTGAFVVPVGTGAIHVLLLIALVILVIRLLQGRI